MIKLFQLALPLIMINSLSYGRSAWFPGGDNSKQNQSGDSNRRNVKNQNSNGYNETEQSRRVNRRHGLGSNEAYVVDGEIQDTHPVYHSVINYNNNQNTTKNKKQKEEMELGYGAVPLLFSPFLAGATIEAAKKDKEENMTQTNAELAKDLKDHGTVKDMEKHVYDNIENVMAEDNRRRLIPDKKDLEDLEADDIDYHDYHPNMITGKQYREDERAAAFLSTASPKYRHEAMNDPKKAIKQATKLGSNMDAYTMDAKEANYYLTRSSTEKDVEYMLAAFIISKDLDRYARRHPKKFIRDVLEGKKYRAFIVPVAKNIEKIKYTDEKDIHSFIRKYRLTEVQDFNFHKFAEFLKKRAERIMVIRTAVQTTLYGVRKLRKGKAKTAEIKVDEKMERDKRDFQLDGELADQEIIDAEISDGKKSELSGNKIINGEFTEDDKQRKEFEATNKEEEKVKKVDEGGEKAGDKEAEGVEGDELIYGEVIPGKTGDPIAITEEAGDVAVDGGDALFLL
jgi:hypothetical protein